MNMAAACTNTAGSRRIEPVEAEQGGEGGVELCAALPETLIVAGVAVERPAQHINGYRLIAVCWCHWCISFMSALQRGSITLRVGFASGAVCATNTVTRSDP